MYWFTFLFLQQITTDFAEKYLAISWIFYIFHFANTLPMMVLVYLLIKQGQNIKKDLFYMQAQDCNKMFIQFVKHYKKNKIKA